MKRKKRTDWEILKKVTTNKHFIEVYPCKPFMYGYKKLIERDRPIPFATQEDLTESQKQCIRLFTGGIWNMELFKALFIQRCNVENPDDLVWEAILTHIETYLSAYDTL